jgi:hypothetical protein
LQQQQRQNGDNALRELRERELTLAMMNQQFSVSSSQGQHQSLNQHSGLAPSILADIYAAQGRPDPAGSSRFNQSSFLQSSAVGRGGLDNQNQLMYTDALHRMLPSSSVPLGRVSAASANPYSNLNWSPGGDHSSRMFSGALGGMNHLPAGAAGTGTGGIPTSGLDPLTAAFLRDNGIMRERFGARGTADLQLQAVSTNSNYMGPLLGGTGVGVGAGRDWTTRSLEQQLLAGSQLPTSAQTVNPLMGRFSGASMGLQQQSGMVDAEDTLKFPTCLPVVLAVQEDNQKLSSHQVLLRNQIEAFRATEDDLTTHTRGRNKPIKLGQVGIRCRHCARLPVARRQKGSTYFPASLHGLYQAAQNMNTTHMQSGLCTEMPPEYKQMFGEATANKVSSSVAGRPYWAKTAKQLGLIDTEDGIRFILDLTPSQIAQIKIRQQQQQRAVSGSGGSKVIQARIPP